MGDEITAGEVSRALDRLRSDVHDDIADLRSELREGLDRLNFVPRDELQQQQARQDARIGALEEWQTWAMRLVLGAVLLAVISLVVTSGLA